MKLCITSGFLIWSPFLYYCLKDLGQAPQRLSAFLKESGDGVEEWMYWPKALNENRKPFGPGSIGIAEVVEALRAHILEQKPEWSWHKFL